ncbi:hypothetical protein ACFL1B_02750 [Nanoarchaeota archaeon]
MVEGDEWKEAGKTEAEIWLDEYTSILDALQLNLFEPLALEDTKNKHVVEVASAELEGKIAHPDFEKQPFALRTAYKNLKGLVDAIGGAEHISPEQAKAIHGLTIICGIQNSYIQMGRYEGTNPCRSAQYGLAALVNKDRSTNGTAVLNDSMGSFLDTCARCPYRAESPKP